jgi:hypothetical protein
MAKKAPKKTAKKAVKKAVKKAKKVVKKAVKKTASTAGILPSAGDYPKYVLNIEGTDGVRRIFGPHTDFVMLAADVRAEVTVEHNETTAAAGPNLSVRIVRQ